MAKQQSFGEKVAKQKAKAAEEGIVVKLIESKKSPDGTSWKFNERFKSIAVCEIISERCHKMARRCQVTGKKPASGNQISHAHNVNKRRFLPNLKKKRYWVPEEDRFVTLTVSTHGMKIIDRVGISQILHEMRARGEKLHFGSSKKARMLPLPASRNTCM